MECQSLKWPEADAWASFQPKNLVSEIPKEQYKAFSVLECSLYVEFQAWDLSNIQTPDPGRLTITNIDLVGLGYACQTSCSPVSSIF